MRELQSIWGENLANYKRKFQHNLLWQMYDHIFILHVEPRDKISLADTLVQLPLRGQMLLSSSSFLVMSSSSVGIMVILAS